MQIKSEIEDLKIFLITKSGDLKLTWPLSQYVYVTSNGHVIIKHNDDTSGNAIWGNSRTIMIVHGSQTSVILPTVTGEYLIKYQDQTLIQSENTASVIVSDTDLGLVDRRLAGTIKENTTFGGVKTAFAEKHMEKSFYQERLAEIPLGRFGTPRDIAETVLFLASDESSYMVGESINVNGGLI